MMMHIVHVLENSGSMRCCKRGPGDGAELMTVRERASYAGIRISRLGPVALGARDAAVRHGGVVLVLMMVMMRVGGRQLMIVS